MINADVLVTLAIAAPFFFVIVFVIVYGMSTYRHVSNLQKLREHNVEEFYRVTVFLRDDENGGGGK